MKKMVQSIARFNMGIIAITLLFLSTSTIFANSGVIKGKVLDLKTNKPLPNANVVINGTNLGIATNKDGTFEFNNLRKHIYNLQVSFLGYRSVTKTCNLLKNKEVNLEIKLEKSVLKMKQIVVTATRSKQLLEDVPVVTEVISEEEIAAKGAENISEILEDHAGVVVAEGTNGGKFIYLNGVDSKRILVMVDNVPVTGKINDRIPLNYLEADNIDHVEIVKGPGTSLYGSDAMGGIINIITKSTTKKLKFKVEGKRGSHDLLNGGSTVSGNFKNIGYYFNLSHKQKGEERVSTDFVVDNSEFNTVNSKLNFKFLQNTNIEFTNYLKNDYQNSSSNYARTDVKNSSHIINYSSNIKLNFNYENIFDIQLLGYHSNNFKKFKTNYLGTSFLQNSVDTTKEVVNGIKTDFAFHPIEFVNFNFGFDHSQQDYENNRINDIESKNSTGIFSQTEFKDNKYISVIIGIRRNSVDGFDKNDTYNLSAMIKPIPIIKIRGTYGTGFKTPSFFEQYANFMIPGAPILIKGNPDLEPETSRSYSFGIEALPLSSVNVSLSYFNNSFENMIVDFFSSYYPQMTASYDNLDKAEFNGFDFQLKINPNNKINTIISYTYTNGQQKEGDIEFSKVAPHSASFKFNYKASKNLVLSLRDQFYGNREVLQLVPSHHGSSYIVKDKKAHNILDISANFNIDKKIDIRFGLDNLLNYTDENYGPFFGRTFYAGISTKIFGE